MAQRIIKMHAFSSKLMIALAVLDPEIMCSDEMELRLRWLDTVIRHMVNYNLLTGEEGDLAIQPILTIPCGSLTKAPIVLTNFYLTCMVNIMRDRNCKS